MTEARRGDVWLVAFGAGRQGEPVKNRPAVVVSADELIGSEPIGLVVVVPLSASMHASPARPEIAAGEGVDRDSIANCRAIQGVNRSRLLRRLGAVEADTLSTISYALTRILDLDR